MPKHKCPLWIANAALEGSVLVRDIEKAPKSDSGALCTNVDGGILAGRFRFSLASAARHHVSEELIGGEIDWFRYMVHVSRARRRLIGPTGPGSDRCGRRRRTAGGRCGRSRSNRFRSPPSP